MSSEPIANTQLIDDTAEIAEEFRLLSDEWIRASEFLSSPTQIAMLWPYQRIIGFGLRAVPLILAELEKEHRPWFWALRAITGEDPVADDDRGNFSKMADVWQSWGREHGYVANGS